MDKNMISIDDLVRQRLSGGEEKERPGAWLQMKDLLDSKMPVNKVPATGGGMSKTLRYAAALLLLAGLGVGGYEMSTKFRNDEPAKGGANGDTELTTTTNPAKVSVTKTGSELASPVTDKSGSNSDNIAGNTKSIDKSFNNISSDKHTANAEISAAKTNTSTAGNQKTAVNKPSVVAGTTVVKHNVAHKPGNNAQANKLAAQQDNAANHNNNELIANKKRENNNSVASTDSKAQKANDHKAETTKPAPVIPASGNKPVATGNAAQNNIASKADRQPIMPASSSTAATKSSGTGNTPKNPKKAELIKDSITKMEVKERYARNGSISMDTVSIGKIERDNTIIADNNELALASSQRKLQTVENAIVPNSALNNASASKEGEMLPLEKFKISSEKSHINTSRFEEMVQNAKFNFSRVTFHPGVLAGINSSVAGRNSTFGVQAGLFGVVGFSDHWSLLGELKYFNQFNMGGQVRESYNRTIDTSLAASGNRNYVHDSVDHYFDYTTLSSLQMPLAIRYAVQRFTAFTGVNFTYNFAVNSVTDLGKTYRSSETLASGSVNYKWENGAPQISVKDFSSRFSIGYLFGMAYQMSPAMQLDVRVTQAFWDNAKTPGAKTVSKALYDNPSLQLNISYRFGKSKYRR